MPTAMATLHVNRTLVEWSPIYGRYLVAQQNTSGHSLLIEELPFAVGPKSQGGVVCLGCYSPELENCCPQCGWPLCEECSKIEDNVHKQMECRIFKEAKARFYRIANGGQCPQLDCIMPLRWL
ncbi:uncharacterized protein Dwil_GK27951 [Drosophila willistoni]|uniref:Uncharacterized protein n=1 Tax=Drosophila willistoni TaxID=7260 RepID=A0A0Q9WWS2_DROWI|nr:uncharacterized protein Dwil_GK27951 [Drosophila willistoni]